MSDNNSKLNDLAKTALTRIRNISRGNGVAVDSIKIIKNNSEFIKCEAITHIELSHETKEERKKGQHQIGELLDSPESLPQQIEKVSADAIKNTEVRQALSNILLKRTDKGFSIHAEYFDIPALNREYSTHQPCPSCEAQGKTSCQTCGGRKVEQCNQCHGRTTINCSFCHGSGFMKGPDGKQTQCNRCFGQRSIKCPLCQSRGTINCRQCKGVGNAKCHACDGSGVFTHVIQLFFKMKTLFEIDRAALPHPAVKMIEDHGGKLVEQAHIALEGEAVKREDGGLAIQYNFQFPYADLNVGMNGQPMNVQMFGYKAKMLKITNFLDQLIQKNYALLLRAANNDGNITAHIRKASKTRMIGEGLILSVTMPPKQAMKALKKKFPFGASNQIIKDIIIQSNKALINISRKSHLGGLIMGLVISTFMNIIYFIGPVRNVIANIIGQGNFLSAVDFILIPLGAFLTIMLSKAMAASPLKKALGPLMPEKQRASFKPRNSNASWPAFIGAAIVFLGVAWLTTQINADTPSWLPF